MTMRILNNCFFVAALSLPVALYSEKVVEFPGKNGDAKSPDGRYLVENVDSDKEPHHSLLLKNLKTGGVHSLCNYKRHVTALWSPDGQKLVVNDSAGSDFSKSLIFFVDQSGPPVDIGAKLLQSLKDPADRRSVSGNHHVYVAVTNWQGNQAVKLRVWGYGDVDPKGFSRLYLYTLDGSFRRAH